MRVGNYVTGMGIIKKVVRNVNSTAKHGIERSAMLSDVLIVIQ
jgi:hypothetical protein